MPAAVSASRTTLEGTDLLLVTIRDNTAQEQYRTQVDLLGRVLRHNLRNEMNVLIGSLGSIEERSDDTNRTPTEHGSGLGLWIVQQLVEVFDGHLDIDRSPDSAFTTEVSMRLQPGTSGYAPGRTDHP